jgi:hypothetical protein
VENFYVQEIVASNSNAIVAGLTYWNKIHWFPGTASEVDGVNFTVSKDTILNEMMILGLKNNTWVQLSWPANKTITSNITSIEAALVKSSFPN